MGMMMLMVFFYPKHLYVHWAKMPHGAGDGDTQGEADRSSRCNRGRAQSLPICAITNSNTEARNVSASGNRAIFGVNLPILRTRPREGTGVALGLTVGMVPEPWPPATLFSSHCASSR